MVEIEYKCRNVESAKSKEQLRKGYRASKVKSRIIFDRNSSDAIEIVRVLHERMVLETYLGGNQRPKQGSQY